MRRAIYTRERRVTVTYRMATGRTFADAANRDLPHVRTAEDHNRARLEFPTARLQVFGSARQREACGRSAWPRSQLRRRSGHRLAAINVREAVDRAGSMFFQSGAPSPAPPAGRQARTAVYPEL